MSGAKWGKEVHTWLFKLDASLTCGRLVFVFVLDKTCDIICGFRKYKFVYI